MLAAIMYKNYKYFKLILSQIYQVDIMLMMLVIVFTK